MKSIKKIKEKTNGFTRFLNSVEYLGNLLPHPITLFATFCIVILITSFIASYFGLSVLDPRDGISKIEVVNLLNADGIRRITTSLVTNFTGFTPLGTVLVALMGVAVAEHSGLLSALMRTLVLSASKRMVTVTIVFSGIVSNTASELGYLVLVPLAAMIFRSLGRHPLAGLAAAFAGVSGGYSANLLLGTVDPLLSGITQTAAQIIDKDYIVGPEANWYFMFASTFLVSIMGALITEKIVEPKLGKWDESQAEDSLETANSTKVTAIEKKALKYSLLTFALLAIGLAFLVVPENAVLRNPETGEIAGSPFLLGIVSFILIFFAIPGFVFGKIVGNMKSDKDVINAMSKSMSSLGMYIVLVFFCITICSIFFLDKSWANSRNKRC